MTETLNKALTFQRFASFARLFHVKFKHDEITDRAAAVAFNLVLSIFPAILFLFSLIPYVPIPNLNQHIMNFLASAMPAGIYQDSLPTINDIIGKPKANLLSFGFILTLYAATSGVMEIMNALNKCHHSPIERGFIRKRLVAVALTFIVTFGLLFAITAVIVGQFVLSQLDNWGLFISELYYLLLHTTRFIAAIGIFYIVVCAVYYYGPSTQYRERFFTIGAAFSSVGAIALTRVFSFYLSNFSTYNKLYGSIGTLIGFMLWIYLLTLLLLSGFEMNECLHHKKMVIAKLTREGVLKEKTN
jgi:membrane protein